VAKDELEVTPGVLVLPQGTSPSQRSGSYMPSLRSGTAWIRPLGCAHNLFRGYIEMEIQLREFDECRFLYQKFIRSGSENCVTWITFARLEEHGIISGARSVFERAVQFFGDESVGEKREGAISKMQKMPLRVEKRQRI
jgi:hypothetical protein